MNKPISHLYGYNVWANERVLHHLQSLPVEIFHKEVNLGFKSLAEVIGHIASADEVWFSRMKEEKPSRFVTKPFVNIEEASNYFNKLQTQIHQYLLSMNDVEKRVTYRNAAGQEFQYSISEIIQHIVNHGTYHRGNISTMLRYLGYKGIKIDYFVYLSQ
ncbi:DinB family protein [Paenibacillus phocaensis]|uniref:DinB family protein n=1 Tax=Paenibacillus phocaensis TaxID=1776378 RepID=UPI00039CA875|nr:DinB family protein [Paenibacillus phocaensis]